METPSVKLSPAQTAHGITRRPPRGLLLALTTAVLLTVSGPAAAADAARGEEIVQGKCFICHGAAGESSSPVFPRLAGQNAGYVARQLADYRSGKRKSTTMQPMVEDLSPDDFKALGAYFASRPTIGHAVADPELALGFPADRRWLAQGINHLGLLSSPEVYERLRGWLSA